MKTKNLLLIFGLISILNLSKARAQTFTDVYSSTNIPHGEIFEIFDYNNDGLEDWVYLKNGATYFSLLQNNGNGNFTDVTVSAGFPSLDPNLIGDIAPQVVDIDNDGDFDVFYWETLSGSVMLHLWENRNGVFKEVSSCIGWDNPILTVSPYSDGFKSFTFIDYDKDGDLDITYNDFYSSTQSTILLRNDININGAFDQKIVLITGYPSTHITRVYPFDFDNDNDFDFIGWETTPSSSATFNFQPIKLFRNDGSGIFSDISSSSGLTSSNYYGGITYFDYNNDGFLDVLFGCTDNNFNATPDNKLFQNNGDGTFTDITSINNLHSSNHYHGVATAIDYDNDGDEDVCWDRSGFSMNLASFFTNQSSSFVENSQALGINVYYTGGQNYTGGRRWVDFDNDGLLDEFVGSGSTTNYLFKNNLSIATSKYLNVTLKGCSSPTDPSGARVVVYCNGHSQTLYYISDRVSTNKISSKILHFGMGSSDQADSVIVYWPSGNVTKEFTINANQSLLIEEDPMCTRSPSYIASVIDTLNATMCSGDSLFVGGAYQFLPGTYLDYYPLSGTCDSLVLTNLSYSPQLPPPSIITGPDTVCENQQNVIFAIQPVSGANSYQWSVPVGSTLNSGGGTASINITFGTGAGYVVVSAVNSCGIGLPASFYVTTETCTGIDEISGLTSLYLYPNPSDNILNVGFSVSQLKNFTLDIKDVVGKSLIHPKVLSNLIGSSSIQIPIDHLANGIYFLVLSSEDGMTAKKIVIEHK